MLINIYLMEVQFMKEVGPILNNLIQINKEYFYNLLLMD